MTILRIHPILDFRQKAYRSTLNPVPALEIVLARVSISRVLANLKGDRSLIRPWDFALTNDLEKTTTQTPRFFRGKVALL